MTFFKTKRGAICVLIIAVVFGIVFGTYRSTTQARQRVEQVYNSAVAELALLRIDAAFNLVSMGNKVGADTSALSALCEAYATADFDETCQIQLKLTASLPPFDELELTEEDQATIRSLEQQMESWLFAMKSSAAFAEKVDWFNNQVHGPLASLFGIEKLTVLGEKS